jgi:hypothetical protein
MLLDSLSGPVVHIPMDFLPRSAGHLLRRDGRPAHDWRHLVGRDGEHVVQHQCDTLGRRQPIQHDEQRSPHRLGQQRLLVDGPARAVRGGENMVVGQRDLVTALPRPELIQALPSDDCGQPAAEVPHLAQVGFAGLDPGLLHGLVGIVERSEHAERDAAQVRPVGLESRDEPRIPVHRSPLVLARRQAGTSA